MKPVNEISQLAQVNDQQKTRVNPQGLLRIYKVFGRHYKKYRKSLIGGFLSLFALIAIVVLLPWPLKLILDYVILQKPLPEQLAFLNPLFLSSPTLLLVLLGLSILLLAVLGAIFSYLNKYWIASAGKRINADIRERVFVRLQRLSLSFHESSHSGNLVYLLTSDTTKMKNILIDFPQDFMNHLFTLGSTVVIMLALDWRLGLIALSAAPLLFLFTRYFGAGMNRAMRKVRNKEGNVAAVVSENVTAMALIQAYGREDTERMRFNTQNRKSLKHKLQSLRLFKTYGRVSDLLVILSTAGVLYFGGRYALRGDILPGTLVVFVAYLQQIYDTVKKLSETFLKLAVSQVSGERLVELVENDMIERDDPGARPLTSMNGGIEFRNISFAYKKNQNVLENLSFKVDPGETVALVGHSGAGKSTLISLLMRFYDPQQGCILIDGRDIRKFTVKSLRDRITILLQDARLFQSTIHENIAFGKPDATKAEIMEAARLAEAHDFIMQMPDGYGTMILEGGNNLSGGQKQRINIARAIIRNTPLVILDEPATGLDALSEEKVYKAIQRLIKGKTAFIIAHKFSSILNVDKIILLEEGQLAHIGSHQQLLRESEQYREFYELQFGHHQKLEMVNEGS